MKLHFLGASGGIVTGSSYVMDMGNGLKIMVDCGMFQGEVETEALNTRDWPVPPQEIKYMLLTHAHLDHTGLIPKLVKDGFRGKIYSTDATKQLTEIILMDAAKLQEEDFKRHDDSEALVRSTGPLYTQEDVMNVMPLFETYSYNQNVEIGEGVTFRMREAGHILGSATFEVWYKNGDGRERKIVFSGDLGQTGARIIRDPDFIREADYVICESTYGSRNHKDKNATLLEMLGVLNQASKDRGIVIIPSFAVERTQEILYEINLFVEKGVLQGLKFFVDSPLAIKATEIFRQYRKYYDEDAMELIRSGDDPFSFKGLYFTQSTKESMKIAEEKGAVVIAGSGMCTGGRVLHHLKNHLSDPRAHVLFVGFQVPGTLGRRIVDGEKTVRIHGQEVEVRAQVHTLGGFSAHADQTDLLYWLRSFGHSPKQVFITHGDQTSREVFAQKITEELVLNTLLPSIGQVVELD